MKPKFSISALGCKVSQYDAAVLKRSLLGLGFILDDKNPDLIIINTCAVTKSAISKDREMIKKMHNRFKAAKLVIMGCWPQTHDDINLNLENVILWGVGDNDGLVLEIKKLFKDEEMLGVFEQGLIVPLDRSRYFLKVGDGCNQFCSYCLIPYARGRIKSRNLEELILEAEAATKAGYGEIILSGIHLGRYGQDLEKKESLVSLLQKLIAIPNLGRLRLSSIEINEVDDELISLMASTDKICQHLHISLQSGCDKILKLMKRPYTTDYFRERIKKLRAVMPEIAISTDVIVGFPGENGEDFADTGRFVEEMAFSKVHVFSFSAHEKTVAFSLPEKVSYEKIKQRSKILREISKQLEFSYEQKMLKQLKGRKIKVIIERVRGGDIKGKTEFHFDIPIKEKGAIGSIVEITA